ncbi:MAG: FecR domain-containing protein [Planctomycetes bacterium]|nr:FecR domain-containing protein [Planctomycetota bacterium]
MAEEDGLELLDDIRNNDALMDELSDQVFLDAILKQLYAKPTDSQTVIQKLKEMRASNTANAVISRLKEAKSERSTSRRKSKRVSGASRSSRNSRRSDRRRNIIPLWLSASLCAAAAVIILLIYAGRTAPIESKQGIGIANSSNGTNANTNADSELILTMKSFKGSVRKISNAGATPALNQIRILPGEAISTEKDSVAVVAWPDGTEMSISQESYVRVADTTKRLRNRELYLDKGSFSAKVEPQPVGRPFIANSSHGGIEVVGTEFTFMTEPDMDRLKVTKGAVKIRNVSSGKTAEVKAGYEGRSGGDDVLVVRSAGEMRRIDPKNKAVVDFDRYMLGNASAENVENAFSVFAAKSAKSEPRKLRKCDKELFIVDLGQPGKAFTTKPGGSPDWSQPNKGFFEDVDRKVALATSCGVSLKITVIDLENALSVDNTPRDRAAALGFVRWFSPIVKTWISQGHEVALVNAYLPKGMPKSTSLLLTDMSAEFKAVISTHKDK